MGTLAVNKPQQDTVKPNVIVYKVFFLELIWFTLFVYKQCQ